MVSVVIKHLLYYVSLAIIIVIQLFYGKPLYDYSVTFIEQLQAKFMSDPLTALFVTFSTIGETFTYLAVMFLVFAKYGTARGFYYLCQFCAIVTWVNFTKISYHDPRPYMSSDAVVAIKCSHEFGNASGHSLSAAGFTMFYFLDFLHGDSKSQTRVKYIAGIIGGITYVVLVGCARVYQGVHSIDQVILGWQLGIWTACYFHYCLRTPLINHIESIASDKNLTPSYHKWISFASSIFLIGFIAQIASYYIVDSTFDVPEIWIIRLNSKCGQQHINKTFHYKSMAQSGASNGAFFGYIAILISRRILGTSSNALYQTQEFSKLFGRLLVTAMIASPFGLMALFVPYGNGSLWIPLIFKFMIPVGGCYFSLYAFAVPFFKRFNLLLLKDPSPTADDQEKPLLRDHNSDNDLQPQQC